MRQLTQASSFTDDPLPIIAGHICGHFSPSVAPASWYVPASYVPANLVPTWYVHFLHVLKQKSKVLPLVVKCHFPLRSTSTGLELARDNESQRGIDFDVSIFSLHATYTESWTHDISQLREKVHCNGDNIHSSNTCNAYQCIVTTKTLRARLLDPANP